MRLPGSDEYEAILVPDAPIVTDQSRKVVMTVKSDGIVSQAVRARPDDRTACAIIRRG